MHLVLGRLPFCLEADPFVVHRHGLYYLYNHDLLGIKEHTSRDGLHFHFRRYIVFGALRPYVHQDTLYYEKITNYLRFPFFRSELRSRHLLTGVDTLITNQYPNNACPSIINGHLFYSTDYAAQPDHGLCEPTRLRIHHGPEIHGLPNISALRQFGQKYLGTLIENINGLSCAKIVECHPLKFPHLWRIGQDFLTAHQISPQATHVYIPFITDKHLYINVRFGRKFYSPEKIFALALTSLKISPIDR